MPVSALRGGRLPIELWAQVDDLGDDTLGVLRDAIKLPWVFHHVAAARNGHVVATLGAAAPAALGMLSGDGAVVQDTGLSVSELPADAEVRLRAAVPTLRGPAPCAWADRGLSRDARTLLAELPVLTHPLYPDGVRQQLGTRLTGLVGLYSDQHDRVWFGARVGAGGAGMAVMQHHRVAAAAAAHNDHLPREELAAFLAGSAEHAEYMHDASWVQRYGVLNRRAVAYQALVALGAALDRRAVYCQYNALTHETHFDTKVTVSRCGAARAGAQDPVAILPWSGPGCVAEGRGAELSFSSVFVDDDLGAQQDLVSVVSWLKPLVVVRELRTTP